MQMNTYGTNIRGSLVSLQASAVVISFPDTIWVTQEQNSNDTETDESGLRLLTQKWKTNNGNVIFMECQGNL
jgi:hypothetical protein